MPPARSALHRKLEHLRYLYRHGGTAGLLFCSCYRLVNCFTRLRIFRVAVLDASTPVAAQLGQLDAYRHGLFTPAELARYVDDPENDLTQDFLDYASAQGGSCYAIFDGELLVSYCWNSTRPTRIEDNLHMDFRPGYIYRYKEFTRPSHRGLRLTAYARAESLRHFAAAGALGFAGYVEADNCISYRALQRAQHRFPGFIVVLGKAAQARIWHSPQAQAWGFRLFRMLPEVQPQSSPGGQGQLAQSGTKEELRIR